MSTYLVAAGVLGNVVRIAQLDEFVVVAGLVDVLEYLQDIFLDLQERFVC